MSNIKVLVQDANNVLLEVTPVPLQQIAISRGVAGRGISDVQAIEINNALYLEFFFTDGTTEIVGPVGTIQYIGQSPIVVNASTISLTTVPVNLGGTNATTASGARTNLGLGTIATQDASAVAITGGSITGITDLAVADGGTGASTAAGAMVNLLPSYTGNANKRLGLNSGATGLEWVTDGGGTVTSIDVSGGTTGLSFTGGPVTTSGTITLGGTLDVDNGGTGATTAAGARTNLNAVDQALILTAGTGLSGGGDLTANRSFSISNTGVTAASYGAASKTLTATVNAQGQLTVLADTPIAIANTQISGLGTMSTQNASSVAITGGSITGITDLAVADGGTGASDASGARTNLGAAASATTISAGTGLSGGGDLSANRTLSIANTAVTAGSYGSASNTLTATVNAQGQLTALAATPIAIANTQISGLGTMSTQNSNSVTITGGSITGITDLAIADGGTGASTASGARSNLGLGTAAVLDAGVANGVATLDGSGTIPLSQIPASIQGGVSYQGSWNAATNTPTLTSSVGSKGYYYVVSVAGSTNLNGVTDWLVGDWAIFNGSVWQKIDNTDSVASVNGYTGAVVLTNTDVGAPPTSLTISAGTGLTGGGDLSTNRTLSIANTTVTAASYGSASAVPTFTVNGQGQLTAASNTTIAIANTQVSGLGTMSTQNANNVSITGGSITGITDLAIADGGTGASTAADARTNLGVTATGQDTTYLYRANNLSDLSNAATARTNLGLGTAATQNSTAFATAAQGALADTAIQTLTSTDGSVTITPTGTSRDLSVAVAASTTNVICQVRNTTGATLTKGTVVYISGATGQIPTVSKALATSDATSAQTLGMMTADLANNTNGYVTIIGLITNIDTSSYTDGQQLYLSGTTAGAVTSTKPYAPIHLVYVAVVEYAHPVNGKLFVKVQNGYELDEIHNVSAQTPSNGQTIVYNSSNQLWENNTVSLTLGVNGTLPVTNGGTGVTTSTGSGSNVLSTSPTLVTPVLGTPTSVTLTNATGLPLTTGVTGTLPIANGGTGQTTANAAFNALAPSQTGNSGKYLTTDGSNTSWATNPLGTVTSVAQSFTGGLISVSGSPITSSGTLALTVAGTSGGVPYFSSASTWATSAALAANSLVVGGGAGNAPATVTTGTGVVTALGVNTGTAGAFVVNGGALGTPSSGTVTNLTGTASININGTVGATTPSTGNFTTLTENGVAVVTQSDIGSAPNEIPLNQYLGSLAYQNGDAYYNTGMTVGFRNRIINGAMMIDQRNAGAAITLTTTASYPVDRWAAFEESDGVMTAQQVSDAPAGFLKSIKFTTTTPDSSITGAERVYAVQTIEANNIIDLAWGTTNAQPVTVSFWVKSSLTGTFGGSLRGTLNYPYTYTINTANTWEYKTITIGGPTTGSWPTDNSGGITVCFGMGVGPALSGGGGAWTSSNFIVPLNCINVISTNGANLYVTGVQLEKGNIATSFDVRPYGTELALCQRYCFVIRGDQAMSGINTNSLGMGIWNGSTGGAVNTPMPVSLRTAPTSITVSSPSHFQFVREALAWETATSITLSNDQTGPNAVAVSFGATSDTRGYATRGRTASTSAVLAFNAEL